MEKSCGCIIFDNNKVLIIKQKSGFYGFPKGHMEKDEKEEETAYRETLEEVGLDVSIFCEKRFSLCYLVHDVSLKEVVYFMAKVNYEQQIKIQEEEVSDAFWVDCCDVYDILTFDNLKVLWLDVYNYYMEHYYG